jgi:hypothetical protein
MLSGRIRAFALADLLAALVTVAFTCALIAHVSSDQRRLARLGEDLAHLREIGVGTAQYGGDFSDQFWSLSWQPGIPQNTPWPDLNDPPTSPQRAALAQTTYLIRTLGNLTSQQMPSLTAAALVPHHTYSHLVLLSYLDRSAPDRLSVSSADHRWRWANDPVGYNQGLYSPHLGVGGGLNTRHPFGSTWRIGFAFFDDSPVALKVSPGNSTGQLVIYPNSVIVPHLMSSTSHPSQKVHVSDSVSRHFGKDVWHMLPDARTVSVQVDGHARAIPVAELNRGASPNFPDGPAWQLTYTPSAIEPPFVVGQPSPYPGPLWTRMGLQGRDFGGPEVYPTP